MTNYMTWDVKFDSYFFNSYLSMDVNILVFLYQYLVFVNVLVHDFVV
jgi:hypothetical protein